MAKLQSTLEAYNDIQITLPINGIVIAKNATNRTKLGFSIFDKGYFQYKVHNHPISRTVIS